MDCNVLGMRELKPKLMIANSGRRRRGLGGGFWTFLTFLIVFLVGVYVGTKVDDMYSAGERPSQAKKESPAVKNTVRYETDTEPIIDKSEITAGSADTTDNGEAVLSEDNKISREMIAAEPRLSVTAPGEDAKTDPGLTSIDPAQMSGEAAAVDNAAPVKLETPAPDQVKADETKAGKAPKKGYTLQVGAFANKADAEKAVNEYRGKGFGAYTVEVENSKGEKWNLVKIGKYGTIEQAWNQSAIFKKSVGKEAYVESLGSKTVFNESWGKNE